MCKKKILRNENIDKFYRRTSAAALPWKHCIAAHQEQAIAYRLSTARWKAYKYIFATYEVCGTYFYFCLTSESLKCFASQTL